MNQSPVQTCSPSTTTIGWIGTGVMGAPMAAHLLAAGYPLVVHNRTRSKAEALIEAGAHWAQTPAVAADRSDVVVSMVGYPEDVRQVYLGERGVFRAANPAPICIDMTTTAPSLVRELSRKAADRGLQFVDAPVSGGDVGARDATLSIMVGGPSPAVAAVRPLFAILGRDIVHQGPSGSGQHAKMCNQIVIAGTMIGVCESLLYGARAGLDLERMLASIRRGAAGCWTLDHLAPRILARNFEPGFFIDHFVKDMGIALQEAKAMGIVLPGLALVEQLYLAARAQGYGRQGTHALMLALERLCGRQGQ